MIRFSSHEINFTLRGKAKIRAWIIAEVLKQKKSSVDLDYIFCSDEKLLGVNKEFLNHHYYTDIITFDYCPNSGKSIAGEMWISIDRVLENTANYAVPFEEELRRVMIHGVFHLLGYGDKSEEESKKMRQLEDTALKRFNYIQ